MLYPADLPFDSIKLIIEDVRANKAVSDRQKFAKAIWELSGYALKSSLGEPGASFAFTQLPPVDTLSDEQVADYLEMYTSHVEKSVDLIALLPWRAILKWTLLRIAEFL